MDFSFVHCASEYLYKLKLQHGMLVWGTSHIFAAQRVSPPPPEKYLAKQEDNIDHKQSFQSLHVA